VVSDDQPDLKNYFEEGREVLVYRDTDELEDIYRRLRKSQSSAWTSDDGTTASNFRSIVTKTRPDKSRLLFDARLTHRARCRFGDPDGGVGWG
jgi:hypothetical protein